jgi:hypothetical protein
MDLDLRKKQILKIKEILLKKEDLKNYQERQKKKIIALKVKKNFSKKCKQNRLVLQIIQNTFKKKLRKFLHQTKERKKFNFKG